MNPMDRHLDRLFKAAAAAPKEQPGELAFAVEARVLTHWRASRSEGEMPFLLPLFRKGLAFACALMVASLALSWREMSRRSADEQTLANAVVNLALRR